MGWFLNQWKSSLDIEKLQTASLSLNPVFEGASSNQKVALIKGSDLEPGRNYQFFGGLLIVEGNVPDHACITAGQGKVYITGNVGRKSEINAAIPERTKLVRYGEWSAKSRYAEMFDGFVYPHEREPALTVLGSVEEGATVNSNHGIHLSGPIKEHVTIDPNHSWRTGDRDMVYGLSRGPEKPNRAQQIAHQLHVG